MNRYELITDESGTYMVEDDEGEYVRYEEIAPLPEVACATHGKLGSKDGHCPRCPALKPSLGELRALARKADMPAYMCDTAGSLEALARFLRLSQR